MERRDERRAEVRAWLEGILEARDLTASKLARKMNEGGVPISPATLYRVLDPDRVGAPEMDTIAKIEAFTGIKFAAEEAGKARTSHRISVVTPGFADTDATEILGDATPTALQPGPNQGVWRINSRAVELAGFLPGDQVLFDFEATPQPGHLVVAQHYNLDRGSAETLIRIYEPPYLTVRTMDPAVASEPLLIDGKRVALRGAFMRMLRTRES